MLTSLDARVKGRVGGQSPLFQVTVQESQQLLPGILGLGFAVAFRVVEILETVPGAVVIVEGVLDSGGVEGRVGRG